MTKQGAVLGALVTALVAVGGAVEGSGGKPAKGKPAPVVPADPMPVGCVRVTDGHHPVLSRDGKRLAFARTPKDAGERDSRGVPIPSAVTWVRDLVAKKEWSLPPDTVPEGWTDDGALLLRAGYGVDPEKGARDPRVAALPFESEVWSIAWSRDGRRVAYVPQVDLHGTAPVYVVDGSGEGVAIEATKGLRNDQAVILSWSPDATQLSVNGLFEGGGDLPTRRIGVVDFATRSLKVVAQMPDWIDIPGLHGDLPRYRDPRLGGEAGSVEILHWKRPLGPRHGRDLWDASGHRLAWVEGHGWIESDAFVVDPSTGEKCRVTVDGEAKWSPALDAPGRRLAFLTAEDAGVEGTYRQPRVRVLDLLLGEPTDYPIPARGGIPAALRWSADGTQVVYEVRRGEADGCYVQAVVAAKPAPPGAVVRTLELRPLERIVSWLSSYDPAHVHAGIHRAEDDWDAGAVPALREALKKWMTSKEDLVHCLIGLLKSRDVREATPELRAALAARLPEVQCLAARTLLTFQAKEAVPDMEVVRAKSSDPSVKVAMGGAEVGLGDERPWDELAAAAKDKQMSTRRALCVALWRVRLPRSVELLIPLVGDKASLGYEALEGRKTLGDAAQLALQALTGQTLGADPAAWTAWWTGEAQRTLPDKPPVPSDLYAVLGD